MNNIIMTIYRKIVSKSIRTKINNQILGFIYFIKKIIASIINFLGGDSERKPSSLLHYLSIVAIVKNEGDYIAEWIEYHLITGVTKFYIYDNESDDNLKDILNPYIECGIVVYKYWPGRNQQLPVYNDVLKSAKKETFWLAVIDLDEFIVPVSTSTIPEFLNAFEEYGGIEINWLIYGSSGLKTKEEGLVIERFKDHSLPEFNTNRNIKTILNPRCVAFIDVHNAVYLFGKYSVNANMEKSKSSSFTRNGVFDKIRINHYFNKSYEEFLLKKNRGRADNADIRPMDDFFLHDKNEIKNDRIMDKYIPIIYTNIKQRYTGK